MSSRPNLAGMALFARVVQHGGFSEAARRVGIPVSTLSRKISALETSLGVRLLERTTRAVSPTDAGREFLPYCQELLEAASGGQAALERRQQDVTGTLRLAAPPSLSDVLLVPLVDGFLRRHPRASVKVVVTDRHLDLVEDEVDVSLRVGRQTESSLIVRTLTRYRHVLIAAPSYLASAGRLARPSDLRRHSVLGFSKWFGDLNWKLSKEGETESLRLRPWLALNDYAGVIRAAVDGMGVAEAPSIICQQELRRGSLIVPLPAWQFEEVDLSAYSLTRRHRSRVVELFLDHCVANIAGILESETATNVSRPQAKGNRRLSRGVP